MRAKSHVRFTPNSDRESGFSQEAMSALPPKADMCSAPAHVRFVPIADIQEFGSHKKKNPGHCPGLYSIIEFHTAGARRQPLFFIGRQMVLGFFLGLELQKLLMGCLSGTFINEFLKSLKVFSVYESIKIFVGA